MERLSGKNFSRYSIHSNRHWFIWLLISTLYNHTLMLKAFLEFIYFCPAVLPRETLIKSLSWFLYSLTDWSWSLHVCRCWCWLCRMTLPVWRQASQTRKWWRSMASPSGRCSPCVYRKILKKGPSPKSQNCLFSYCYIEVMLVVLSIRSTVV